MQEPEFTETFKVTRSSEHRYRGCINRLRQLSQASVTPSLQLPVLPPQQTPPTQFFDVVLRTVDWTRLLELRTIYRSLRLRIQRDNLYLVGYKKNVDNGQWYEFDNETNTHLIPNSKLLHFESNYTAMQTAAGQRREYIRLGQLQLEAAVNNLLGSTTSTGDKARALIVIIQMICEATRFAFISNAIAKEYTTDAGLHPVTDQIVALEESWAVVSLAVLHHERDPGPLRLPVPNAMGINDIADAAHMIGVVLHQHIPDLGDASTRR